MFPSPGEIKLCYGHDNAPPCPRCESQDTKFCYYNNYSLSQPRYYCKSCRRYWTKGGSLRNIPANESCGKRSKRRRRHGSSKRFGRKENPLDHHDDHHRDSPCPEIDLAAVFENYLNGQSPSSSNDQDNKKLKEEEGIGQFLEEEEDMFEFQSLLNDKDIQEILQTCSFSDHWI